MTDMEKKVMVRLCAKILSETDLYDTDMEVRNLIDWICVSEQIKSNNNEIRSLIGEYKRPGRFRRLPRSMMNHMASMACPGVTWRPSKQSARLPSALTFSTMMPPSSGR